ncbi:MAG: hypothetical protein Q7V88_03865 [Actinomycetota bacterium]|nr:hypothetical protein [Actinomycetota bacterium]
MRDRLLAEPAPGVLVLAGTPQTWRQRLAVATLCSNSAGAAGFQAAAALHGADGFPETDLALLLPSPRRILYHGVTVHVGPFEEIDLTEVDGIRCTTIERTLCDLGSVTSAFLVGLAFEWYWRRTGDLDRLQQTVERLNRPGQRGTRLIQEFLGDARLKGVPTESGLEVRLEAILGEFEGRHPPPDGLRRAPTPPIATHPAQPRPRTEVRP